MENKEEVVKKTMDEAQFLNFEKHLTESADRMANNYLIMFMFLTMFRSSNQEQKQTISGLISALKEEIQTTHLKKSELTFNLTKEQHAVIVSTLEKVSSSSLRPILSELTIFEETKNDETSE